MILSTTVRAELDAVGPLAAPGNPVPAAAHGHAFVAPAAQLIDAGLQATATPERGRVTGTLTVNNRWSEYFATVESGAWTGAFVRLIWRPERPQTLTLSIGPTSRVEWASARIALAVVGLGAAGATLRWSPTHWAPGLSLGVALLVGVAAGLGAMAAIGRSGVLRAAAPSLALTERATASIRAALDARGVTLKLQP